MRILPHVSEKIRTFALETFGDESYSPPVNLGNSYDKANRLYPPLNTLSVWTIAYFIAKAFLGPTS